MRTTLTIDDDVAALLERLRREQNTGLRRLVNDALRRGLAEMMAPVKRREPFRTRVVDLGRPRLAEMDSIAEALSIAEGENFR
jgi:hypothetical protein